jgi:hypothetical protein
MARCSAAGATTGTASPPCCGFRRPLDQAFAHIRDNADQMSRRCRHAVTDKSQPRTSVIRRSAAGRADAASSVSLFGDGSTLAMAGAYTLAEELAAARTDPRPAFACYEAKHRTLTGPRQGSIAIAAALMVPATRTGIAARNQATRLWPAAAATGWLRDRISPRREPSRATT